MTQIMWRGADPPMPDSPIPDLAAGAGWRPALGSGCGQFFERLFKRAQGKRGGVCRRRFWVWGLA